MGAPKKSLEKVGKKTMRKRAEEVFPGGQTDESTLAGFIHQLRLVARLNTPKKIEVPRLSPTSMQSVFMTVGT